MREVDALGGLVGRVSGAFCFFFSWVVFLGVLGSWELMELVV